MNPSLDPMPDPSKATQRRPSPITTVALAALGASLFAVALNAPATRPTILLLVCSACWAGVWIHKRYRGLRSELAESTAALAHVESVLFDADWAPEFNANGLAAGIRSLATRIALDNRNARKIIEMQPECVKILSPDGRLLLMNAAGLGMIEADSFAQVRNAVAIDLVTPAYRKQFKAMSHRVSKGESQTLIFELEGLKGRKLWLESRAVPLLVENGEFHMLAVTRDITEQLQRERELIAAKAQAEKASLAKSEFLANMSHEIRTPMTAILGYSELLLSADLPEDARLEHVQTIQRNGDHLLAILNDILDISKIEAGLFTVEEIDTPLVSVLEDVCSLMRVRATEKKIELKVQADGPLPRSIRSDPVRLRQILMNLVGNAIKFTEQGSVTVQCTTRASTDGSAALSLAIVDTGIGMSDADMGQLFQAFSQADSSTSRRFGGTGLGLHISRRLAEMLGGTIDVESEVGRGSTFRLELTLGPYAQLDLAPLYEELGQHRTRDAGELPAQDCLAGVRILVAEDGRDNQVLIRAILQRAGAVVEIVENGQLALDMLVTDDGGGIDLLLLDMQMPVLDGYATARALRSRGSALPVLALTASAMSGDREKCIAAGCSAYATKPVQRNGLLAACSALLPAAGKSANAA